jgi:alginate O-acetyltransferase complex protein AlgI
MLFNSYEFIFAFLPIAFLFYFYLLGKRMIVGAKAFLVFASIFFYSWWNIAYLPLILSSILANYIIGNSLNENIKRIKVHKKKLLIFGICLNLSLLGYFKYSDFFIENLNLAFDGSMPLLNLALPLAISFFTFQQIAYLVDSYRKETAEYDFLNYALFVTFFPQLIAGPIVHHSEMMPQFSSKWNMVKRYKNIAAGIFIFTGGLFSKVIIADTFAQWATAGFDQANTLNFIEGWATSLSYTFQLYFDFSGYTNMAIGAALLFNIKLPVNFNSPYKALDIQDFWRRWHITLSRFLREYVYIPLGGNKNGKFSTYNNLLATFVIGGIWHGAGWTFVFWGFLHGIALISHRIWKGMGLTMPNIVAWFITFNFINIAWVFFRAKDWDDALKVLYAMFNFDAIVLPLSLEDKLSFLTQYGIEFGYYVQNIQGSRAMIFWLISGFAMILLFKNSTEMIRSLKTAYLSMIFTSVALVISILSLDKIQNFLYFNF